MENDKWLWNAYLTPLAGRRLSSIRKANVQDLHATIGQEHGIYSANRALALLRSMVNKADEIGYRGDNPAKGVKLFREESRDRFLQENEMQSFFAALEAEQPLFRDFFYVSLLSGARRSNVQSMAWADVNLQAGSWRIPETKNGSVVVVPLVGRAVRDSQGTVRDTQRFALGLPRSEAWNLPARAQDGMGKDCEAGRPKQS